MLLVSRHEYLTSSFRFGSAMNKTEHFCRANAVPCGRSKRRRGEGRERKREEKSDCNTPLQGTCTYRGVCAWWTRLKVRHAFNASSSNSAIYRRDGSGKYSSVNAIFVGLIARPRDKRQTLTSCVTRDCYVYVLFSPRSFDMDGAG